MDVTVLNGGKHRTHASHNTGLLAMMDLTAADNVMTDVLFEPSVVLAPAHGVPLHLSGRLYMFCVEVHVILGITVLA